jgi:hypothetical protein
METVCFSLFQVALNWQVVSHLPVAFPLTQKPKSRHQCQLNFILVLISVSLRCWNVSNLISVVKPTSSIRKWGLNPLESTLYPDILLWTVSHSAKFSLQRRPEVFQFIELSYSDISPLWHFNDSLNIGKVNLCVVVDSMNVVIFRSERLGLLFFEYDSCNSFWLSIFVEVTEITNNLTEFCSIYT